MSLTDRLNTHVLRFSGSTRPVSLLRIALALLVWARWAELMRPAHNLEPWRLAVTTVFWLVTPLMLVGLWSRASTAATGLLLLVVFFGFGVLDGQVGLVEHHTWLLTFGVCLLALTPCGGSFSVDRWFAVRRAEDRGLPAPPEHGELWATRLIALQISAVYFWSAVDKSRPAFLGGDRLEQIFLFVYTGADYPMWPGFHALSVAAAWAVVLVEYALAFALWIPRVRAVALVSALALHGVFYWAIPVNTFTMTMWALLVVFLDPDAVHRAIDRLVGVDTRQQGM